MIEGKSYNGLEVDIWSCGVTLYAMLVGYLPFEDPDTIQLYRKISIGNYEEPEHLSEAAKVTLRRMM
jgi:5'-AMP-activated protein kinase catalytic alpha subunit